MAITPEYSLQARLVEGRYPNYNSVIPNDNPHVATVSCEALTNALRRTMVFASEYSQLVKLHFESAQLCLTAQDLDFNSRAQETVPCDYNEDFGFSIGMNASNLFRLLRTLSSEEVRISFSDPSRAALITPVQQAKERELTLLLMPMLLQQ